MNRSIQHPSTDTPSAAAGARRDVVNPRALRSRRPLAVLLLLLGTVASAPAFCASQSNTSDPGAARVSATLDFRIVIPASLRMVRNEEQRTPTRQFTSRATEVLDGRQVVTLARP